MSEQFKNDTDLNLFDRERLAKAFYASDSRVAEMYGQYAINAIDAQRPDRAAYYARLAAHRANQALTVA